MRRLKNKEKAGYSGAVFFLCVIYVLFCVTGTSVSQDKGAKGKKEVSQGQETSDIGAKPEKGLKKAYIYDPADKTDPFKSFIAEQEAVEEKNRTKPRTYLETLDLSQLDLIAIILSPKGNSAMVRDAKGLGYVIRKGTPIGVNGGRVHQIREKEVIIREMYKDFRGQVKFRDIAKKLHSIQ